MLLTRRIISKDETMILQKKILQSISRRKRTTGNVNKWTSISPGTKRTWKPLHYTALNVTMNDNCEMKNSTDHSGAKCANCIKWMNLKPYDVSNFQFAGIWRARKYSDNDRTYVSTMSDKSLGHLGQWKSLYDFKTIRV